MSIKSSYTLTISLFTITILSGIFLSSNIASATDTNTSQDNVTVSVPVSCTMNGTGMTSHNANIPNGTYQADIGTTTLKTFCNDNQGFAIYAIGYTNEEYGNTTLIGATGGQTIVTGTATTTGNPDVSNWAVKLATDSTATYPITLDNSFGAYSSVPSTYTKVAHRDSGTDLGSSATGASLTTTYAAYISKGQKADTYSGQVKYTLVHPSSADAPFVPSEIECNAGKICYNTNAGPAETLGQMGQQTARDGNTVTLYASNFKRDGYGFAGWSDAYDYATNPNANFYGPNATFTVPTGTTANGLSLYAVWIPSAGTIQNWNSCSSLTQAPTDGTANLTSITALTDERDGNTYAVARLADGNCWTIENLRLADKDSNNNDIILSSSNTHNPSLPLTNSWWYSSVNNSDTAPTSNHLSAPVDPTQTAWCQTTSSTSCMDQSMLATNNTTLFINNTSSSYSASGNVYSYGNYYNWYSATAGHGTSSKTDESNVAGDVCPSGWHLPTGKNAAGEFGLLDVALGGTGAGSFSSTTPTGATMSILYRSYPNNFVRSGYVFGASIKDRNSTGEYWSSTASLGSGAFALTSNNVNYISVSPATTGIGRYVGYSVRCIAGV